MHNPLSQALFAALLANPLLAQGRVEISPADAGADVRSATVVVAASDSRSGRTAADFQCDGIQDQKTIARAIAALPAAGGTVQLLEGTFRFHAPLVVTRHNVTLRGQGRSTVIHRPVVGNVDGAVIEIGTAQHRVRNAKVASIRFLRDGLTEAGYTVRVTKAAAVEIDSCAFANLLDGIQFRDVDGGVIRGSRFRNVYRPIRISGASQVRISGNRAEKTGTHWLSISVGERHDPMVRTERDIMVTENFVMGGNSKGMSCQCPVGGSIQGLSIRGNHVSGFGQGIQIGRGMQDAIVDNNVVRDCKGVGLYVYQENNRVALTNNRVRNCSEGIMLGTDRTQQVEGVEVRGNTIEGNNIGIAVSNAARPIIRGNTIRDNNRAKTVGYGILIGTASQQVVIEGNQFSGHNATGRSYAIIGLGNRAAYPIVRNNVFWGAMGADERGVVLGGAATELVVMTDNYFHNYRSVALAVGTLQQAADYRGSRVFDGTKWLDIR